MKNKKPTVTDLCRAGNFCDTATISPFIPVTLFSILKERDLAILEAFGFNRHLAHDPEKGIDVIYLAAAGTYKATSFLEGSRLRDLTEKDLVSVLQGIIKKSKGSVPFFMVSIASTSSLLAPGTHGGSAMFITADAYRSIGTGVWLEEQRDAFEQANKRPQEDEEESQYDVHVVRIGYAHHYARVTGRSEEEAREMAINEACDTVLSEKTSDYVVEDITKLPGKEMDGFTPGPGR